MITECRLDSLGPGNCFMFNRQPYIVLGTDWEDLGLFKKKVFICRGKFAVFDSYFSPDTDIYRISKNLYDALVRNED